MMALQVRNPCRYPGCTAEAALLRRGSAELLFAEPGASRQSDSLGAKYLGHVPEGFVEL